MSAVRLTPGSKESESAIILPTRAFCLAEANTATPSPHSGPLQVSRRAAYVDVHGDLLGLYDHTESEPGTTAFVFRSSPQFSRTPFHLSFSGVITACESCTVQQFGNAGALVPCTRLAIRHFDDATPEALAEFSADVIFLLELEAKEFRRASEGTWMLSWVSAAAHPSDGVIYIEVGEICQVSALLGVGINVIIDATLHRRDHYVEGSFAQSLVLVAHHICTVTRTFLQDNGEVSADSSTAPVDEVEELRGDIGRIHFTDAQCS